MLMKRFIQKMLVNDVCWKVISPFVWLSDRLKASRVNYKEYPVQSALLKKATKIFHSRIVLHGPFKGMNLGNINPGGSSVFAKLLGSYESEIHPFILDAFKNNYQHIINIGCDEGYYAVGFALKCPGAKVSAYDISPSAISNCAALAKLNGVEDRMNFLGRYIPDYNRQIVQSVKTLFLVDCEGDERFIFTEAYLPYFTQADIIVEAHIHTDPEVVIYLEKLFNKTHDIMILNSLDDHLKALQYNYPETDELNYEMRRFITEERTVFMQWLYIKSKHA